MFRALHAVNKDMHELDNIVGTQTKVGFHQQVDFVDVNGSALTLNGEWDVFTDIDNWGSNNGSFIFKLLQLLVLLHILQFILLRQQLYIGQTH